MNFSIKNNSLPRPVVLSQRLSESTRRPLWIDMYFLNASFAKLIRFGRAGGAVAWPLVVRAQQLLVGFSDDRRFFVPVLVPFAFFVFVIIIGGISGRDRVAAHDADEAPTGMEEVPCPEARPAIMPRVV
jgi:hypothetical protein